VKRLLLIPTILFLLTNFADADRGPIIWQEGVKLSQESQKAIILHNSFEEVLILATELKANKEAEILEFIPFPSEPKVSLAKGDPFGEISRLIRKKGLVFQVDDYGVGKGGGGTSSTAPVEIRLSEKIGLHDVTTVKINDIDQFSKWLEEFFKGKGIRADKSRLSDVHRNASDYVRRGINYFVFDSVKVSGNTKFVEPLVYRFKTGAIYYPLKTSNLIGGNGAVELILALPGSISDDIWQNTAGIFPAGAGVDIRMSSSSKLDAMEVEPVCGLESFFGKGARIYLQAFKYSGPYNFKDDFTYHPDKLVPYAYRFINESRFGQETRVTPSLTRDEARDVREAFCGEANLVNQLSVRRYGLDCWNFIPSDEYAIYAALFSKRRLHGIPSGTVVLEDITVRREYKGRYAGDDIAKSFNAHNKVGSPLENAFPRDGAAKIGLRRDTQLDAFSSKARTSVSRAGFNEDRTRALVYVEHAAGPRSAVGHYVIVEKKGGEWQIADEELGTTFGN
jgi:hypothetical protein